MSSYSEYLNRQKMRLPQIVDTRPHRDAGHHTEIVKRLAASTVQESKTPRSAGVTMLNAPSTQVRSFYAKAHTVQDMSVFQDFEAGQAVAQSETLANRKTPQISQVCYSSNVIREKQDTLRLYPQEALKQAAINNLRNCCTLCGEPIQYTTACPCSLTAAQQNSLKDARRRFTTPS
jgi:hypothetical protein